MPKTKVKKKAGKPGRPNRARRLPKGPNRGIELLLVQSVEHLGEQGDVVEVRQGLATFATDHNKRMVEKHRARLLKIHKARIAGLKALAKAIAQKSLNIEANATEEGHLYGSVGAADIVKALKGQEITVTPDQVKLQGPLKELGLYTVQVSLGQGVEAELKVWVVPAVAEQGGTQNE
jgi:large subunit ribosomal protein L9